MKTPTLKKITLLFCCLSLFGCAGTLKQQKYEDQALKDPYEKFNRASYSFNNAIDKSLLKPISKAYVSVIPKVGRKGVNNFFNNASEPLNALNSLLQLKLDDSLTSITRLAFNTTLGLGGLIDISSDMGLQKKEEDFGQTLAFWGMKPGPYLMVPLLGPANVRDFIGSFPDRLLSLSNQPSTTSDKLAITAFDVIHTRSQLLSLDKLLSEQIDAYTFIKSGYEQNRMGQVFDGEPPEVEEEF